jgi:hypothetical protein
MAEKASEASSYYDEVQSFIETLFDQQEGFVYTPTKDPATGRWQTYFFKYPQAKADAVSHICHETDNKEVYLAPSLFKRPQATKAAWKGTNYVWVEFDGNSPEALPQGIPNPSIRIQSSTKGHEHWYWRLDGFESDKNLIEGLSKSLAYTLESDRSGWDSTQVLRPPGTIHHDSGRRVRVRKAESTTHSVADFINLVVPPEEVVINTNITNLPEVGDVVSKYQWPTDARDLFKKQTQPTGSRSEAMMRMAYHCIEMGMEDTEAYVILMNCDDRWGKYKNRSPENRSKVFLDQIAKARQKIGIKAEKKLTEVRPIYSVRELLALDFSDVGWWYEGLYASQTLGFIGGDPGVGKSTFMLQMCMDVTCGKDKFLKWENKKAGEVHRTGFFSFEMDAFQVQYFLNNLVRGYSPAEQAVINEMFKIDPYGSAINSSLPKERQAILDTIDRHEMEFVVFDSLRALTKLKDENIEDFLDWVDKDLRRDRNCSVWVIHHNRKPAQGEQRQEQSLSDLYGSTSIGAAAATVIGLEKKAAGRVQLNHLKTRMAPEFDPIHLGRTEHLHFEIKKEEPKQEIKKGGTGVQFISAATDDSATRPSNSM